jgi:ribulose-5-phosphate 4-epimerase/fuculose-1-phosphate aldolase
VHSHSPSVIPFGVTGTPLRAVYAAAGFVGDGTPVFDTRTLAGRSNLLVSDPAAGRALAQALGAHGAVLMRGHGAAVVGASLPIVVARAIYLEVNAKLQMQAMALGHDVTFLDREEARQMTELAEATNWSQAWDGWKRKASSMKRSG